MTGGFRPNEPWPAGEEAVVAREIVVAGERVRIVESGQVLFER